MRLSSLLAREKEILKKERKESREEKRTYHQGDESDSEDDRVRRVMVRYATTAGGTQQQTSSRIRTRSYSPERSPLLIRMTNNKNSTTATARRRQPYHVLDNPHYAIAEVPDATNGLDAMSMESITKSINERCHHISQSLNEMDMAHILHKSGKDLSLLGFSNVQLWLFDAGGGISSREANHRRISLPPSRVQELLKLLQHAPYECLLIDDKIQDLVSLMQNIAKSYHTITALEITTEPRCNDSLDMVWKSVYFIPLQIESTTMAKRGHGFLLAAETESTASSALQARSRFLNAHKMKQMFGLQCLLQLAGTCGSRLRSLAEVSIKATSRLEEIATITRLQNAEKLLAVYEQLAGAVNAQEVIHILVEAASHHLHADISWVLTPTTLVADDNSTSHGTLSKLHAAANIFHCRSEKNASDNPPRHETASSFEMKTARLQGNHLLSALMGVGYQHRAHRGQRSRVIKTTNRPNGGENTINTLAATALVHPPSSSGFSSLVDDDDGVVCCQSNTVGDVAWADLVSAGLCESHCHSDESRGRRTVEDELDKMKQGIDERFKLICLYIPVATGILPGSGGGTTWENDDIQPSSLSSSQCLLLLAYRISQPPSVMVQTAHPINSLQQMQQQHTDDHSVFDSIETQLAIQRYTQEQALTKANDLSIIAGKALLRLAKELRASVINRIQTSAHALFATTTTSYTKATIGKQVSAWQCINDIQSVTFASHFNAEQIVVLFSDVYATSLGGTIEVPRKGLGSGGGFSKIHLLHAAGERVDATVSFVGIGSESATPIDMGHAWANDLWSSGRPIVMSWLDQVLTNGTSSVDDDRIGGNIHVSEGVGVDSFILEDNHGLDMSAISSPMTSMGYRSRYGDRELVRLVRVLNPNARSIMVFPIRREDNSIGMLLLINKKDTSTPRNIPSSMAPSSISSSSLASIFTPHDAWLIDQSHVCSTIAAALESARGTDMHNHGVGSSYCKRLQAQVSHLGDMLKVQRERQGLHSCFSLWRSKVVGPQTPLRLGEQQHTIATPTVSIEATTGHDIEQQLNANVIGRSHNRALLLTQFAAKAVWASFQRDIGILVSELLPAILQVDSVVLFVGSKRDDTDDTTTNNRHNDTIKSSKVMVSPGKESEIGLIGTSPSFEDIPLFTAYPQATESKIVLIHSQPQAPQHQYHLHYPQQQLSSSAGMGTTSSTDSNVAADDACGVLLVRRTHSDPRHPFGSSLSDWSRDDTTIVDSIVSIVMGSLASIELINTMDTVQLALSGAEGIQNERDELREKLASLLELKNDTDIRCNHVTTELHHLQLSSTALQSQNIQLQQRYQELLENHTVNPSERSHRSLTVNSGPPFEESSLKRGVEYQGRHPTNEMIQTESDNNNSTTINNTIANPSTLLLQQELGEAYSCMDEATQAMTVLQGTQAQLTEALKQAEEDNKALLLRLQQRDEELTAERNQRTSLEEQLTMLHQGSIAVSHATKPNDPLMLAITNSDDESTVEPVKSDRVDSTGHSDALARQAAEITVLNRQVLELTKALGIAQHQQEQQQHVQQKLIHQQQQQLEEEKQEQQRRQQVQRRMHELEDSLSVGANRALMTEQLLGDWRIVARGLNSASTHVSKGVPGVWSQACGVLLSVIGSHVIVDGCGLCLLQKKPNSGRTVDNNNHNNQTLVELVVGDASSPSRSDRATPSLDHTTSSLPPSSSPLGTSYLKHEDHSKHQTSTIADDDQGYHGAVEYARNLIDTRPVSTWGPKIHSVIAGLLSPTSSSSSLSNGLFRYALQRNRPQPSSNHATPSHMTTPKTAGDFEYIDITNTQASSITQEHGGGVLSDDGGDGMANHQLWLVPIRTARSTLAVLRLSVHLQPNQYEDPQSVYDDLNRDSEPLPHPNAITTDAGCPATPAPSYTLSSRGPLPSPSPSWDIALSDVVNFAEQMVPLIVAARQFENSDALGSQRTEEISARDQEIRVCYQQHARYERELQDSAARYELLWRIAQIINMVVVNVSDGDDDNDEVFSKQSSGAGISTSTTAPPTELGTSVNILERLEKLGYQIAYQLTEHFDITADIRIYHPYNQQHSPSRQKRTARNDTFTSSSTSSPSKRIPPLAAGLFDLHVDRPKKVEDRWVVELYNTDGTNSMLKTSFATHMCTLLFLTEYPDMLHKKTSSNTPSNSSSNTGVGNIAVDPPFGSLAVTPKAASTAHHTIDPRKHIHHSGAPPVDVDEYIISDLFIDILSEVGAMVSSAISMFAHFCQKQLMVSQWIQKQSQLHRELQQEHIHTQKLFVQQSEDHKRAWEEQQQKGENVVAIERTAIKALKDQLANQSSQSAIHTEKLNAQLVELTSRLEQLNVNTRVSEHAAVVAVRSSVFHHNLFDLLIECISNNHNNHNRNKISSPPTLDHSKSSSLDMALRDVCRRLPALCSHEDLPYGTNFRIGYYQHNNCNSNNNNGSNTSYVHKDTTKYPLNHPTATTTTTDQAAQTGVDDEWTWHSCSYASPVAVIDVDIFSSLDAGDKEKLSGLAKTCFILRAKSSTDIPVGPKLTPTTFDGNFREKMYSFSLEDSTKRGLRNLRVLSYPLVSPSTTNDPATSTSSLLNMPPHQASTSTECYGVLQIIIPLEADRSVSEGHGKEMNPASESSWLKDSKHLDDCCMGIARMISAVTMMHHSTIAKDTHLLSLEETVQSWDDHRADQEEITQRWMHQAMSWQSLTHLIAMVLARANDCIDFPTAVRQAEVNHTSWSSLLRTHAGISLIVRNALAGDRDIGFSIAGDGSGGTAAVTTVTATTPVRTHTHMDNHNHSSPISCPAQVIPLDKDGTVVVEIRHHHSSKTHLPPSTNNNNAIPNQSLVHPFSVVVHSSSTGTLEANAGAVPLTGPSELIDLFGMMLQSIRTLHDEKQRQHSAVSSSSSSMVTPTRAGIISAASAVSSSSSVAASIASSAASVYGWKPHHPAAEKLRSFQSSTKPHTTTTISSTSPTTSIVPRSSSSSHASSTNRKPDRPIKYNHLGIFHHNPNQIHHHNHHNQAQYHNNSKSGDDRGGIENRPTRMILHVCHELNALLNPPTTITTHRQGSERTSPSSQVLVTASSAIATSSSSSSHPASLTPLQASQDTILKILTTLCTILRSEGSALLLCNTPPETSSNIHENANHAGSQSYQAIYQGTGLNWPGISEGEFGLISTITPVSSPPDVHHPSNHQFSSLVETCLMTGKALTVLDGAADPRFHPDIDGNCLSKTPFLALPLRGRHRMVVGVFLVVKPRGGLPFSHEDVVAAEMVAAAGAIGLYWCRGLGIVQQKLDQRIKTVDKLEASLQEMQHHLASDTLKVDVLQQRLHERETRCNELERKMSILHQDKNDLMNRTELHEIEVNKAMESLRMSANTTVHEVRADAAATISKIQAESTARMASLQEESIATIASLHAEISTIREELTRISASHVVEMDELTTRLHTESNVALEKVRTETLEAMRKNEEEMRKTVINANMTNERTRMDTNDMIETLRKESTMTIENLRAESSITIEKLRVELESTRRQLEQTRADLMTSQARVQSFQAVVADTDQLFNYPNR